jgi:hypothetical protein
MKTGNSINDRIQNLYIKTFGSKNTDFNFSQTKKQNFNDLNLIKIRRKGESLPPVIRKALDYLYPIRINKEINPVSNYDKSLRRLSNHSIEISDENPTKKLKYKKIYFKRTDNTSVSNKSNSQEYINCIGYNGQAESEYMMTKDGVKEYKSLYKLILQDSGLPLDRIRPKKNQKTVHKL